MLKKYLLNTSGNFSIMFAAVSTMLVLGVAVAVDISGVTSQKSKMQSMSDAAVLAAVTSGETNPAKLREIVAKNLEVNNVELLNLDWDLNIVDETVTVNLNSPYDTKMMGFAGKDKMPVSSLSQAKFPEEVPINIALVLDRTGSMDGANMTSLKTASSVLVDQFKEYDADTKVAVVPFSNYVNVASRRNAVWTDVPLDTTEIIPAGPCYMSQPKTCTNYETQTGTTIKDGVTHPTEWQQCTNYENNGPEVEVCPTDQIKETKWHGCIGSRNYLHNQTPEYVGKKIPGIMNVHCGEEVLPLTTDMNQVKAKINSLTASENTYIPVGLMNGWRMLDSQKPFAALSNQDEKRKRALILMTDGMNTLSLQDPYVDGSHTGTDTDEANAMTSSLCNNIKGAGIDIWTVAYNFDDATSKTMLQNCATSSGQFFDASNQAELVKAFEDIGKSLFTVRLTR